MILDEIVANKRIEVKERKFSLPLSELKARINDLPETKGFKNAVSRGKIKDVQIRLIAEIKKASPSKGIIREDFNVQGLAWIYEENGASAISVLTEGKYFLGGIENLSMARKVVNIPILRKDFIFDAYQIYEARAFGADAVLLIASILDKTQIGEFLSLASDIGMDAIVEVHDKKELEKALQTRAEIIGINNRDLKTFKIDLNTTYNLLDEMPAGKVIVSESGINNRYDLVHLQKAGVDAALIGEALMREADIGKKIKELLGLVPEEV
ncbi:MAG: indole-3-glycerol phosphate synthase TrpC [Nitrospirae bacterium]|nr:indole-3-glycerol phosphate synthase TrpC [Nitrospirota bacterium]